MVAKPASGAVRIIGGRWKRTPLPVGDGDGLRPTPDRVRKTLFDWLAHRFDRSFEGRTFLDLFAGSGALGFEAASRGASRVVLVERDRNTARQLAVVRDRLDASDRVEVREGDAVVLARQMRDRGARFDVVFLDPPFDSGLMETVLPIAGELARDAVYVESREGVAAEAIAGLGLTMRRGGQAGHVRFQLLTRENNDEESDDADRDLSRDVRSAHAGT